MTVSWLGVAVCAIVLGYLWSRIWLWLTGRFLGSTEQFVVGYAVAWLTALVIAAFGLAEGGRPDGDRALLICTPALGIWAVIDFVANSMKAERPPWLGTRRER